MVGRDRDSALWALPRSPSPIIRSEAAAALTAFECYLAPGPDEEVLLAVSVTLAVYFDRDFDPVLGPALIETWAGDLSDLPAFAVKAACSTWRRRESKRPTPADIRNLALRDIDADRETLRRLKLTVEAA